MKPQRQKLTKGGVLLVEDDPSLQADILAVLESEHYEVLPAPDREHAEDLMDSASIEIVVLDMEVQAEEGRHLLTRLITSRCHLRTVVIFRSLEAMSRGADVGADAVMAPPLDLERLVTTVNRLLADLCAEAFRERLLPRHATPFAYAEPYLHWGLNE